MSQLRVGDIVSTVGECQCTERPPGNSRAFHDVRDCYHAPSTVGVLFRDGRSVWARNRHGFAQRFGNEVLALVGVGISE